MLGRKLDIEIFGTISEGSIYFGYYRERGMNYKVYILTNHKLKTSEQLLLRNLMKILLPKSLLPHHSVKYFTNPKSVSVSLWLTPKFHI